MIIIQYFLDMKNKENIIGFDFQGWPIYKITIREMLKQLGAIERDGWIGFENDSKILDLFPVTFEDDSMAYGVNPQYITLVNIGPDQQYVNIWREPIHPDVEERIAEIEEEEEKWRNKLKS